MGDLTSPAPAGWVGLVAVVTAVQAVLALLTRALPLFGLPLTLAAGVPPEAVGQLAAATSFGSMVFFLWGPALLAGIAALRQLQIGCALAGLAVLLCLGGDWRLMLLGAFLIGVGYGPSAPAGSDILMRLVPASRRSLVFSVKQAGVPLGGLAAGLVLPVVALAGGVAAALWTAAGIAVAAAAALGLWRGGMEPAAGAAGLHHLRRPAALLAAPLRLLGIVAGDRRIRGIVATGLGLGAAQGVLMGFYPVFLSDHAGLSLAAAGAAFALLQGMGIGGRVFIGWLADRLAGRGRALMWLSFASGAIMLLVATIGPESPPLWVALVSVLAGLTVVSWNGVFLSDLAAAAPEGRVGEVTSAGTFVLFAGYVVCPVAAQVIFAAAGSYLPGLVAAGLIPACAGTVLLVRGRRRGIR